MSRERISVGARLGNADTPIAPDIHRALMKTVTEDIYPSRMVRFSAPYLMDSYVILVWSFYDAWVKVDPSRFPQER